MPPTLLKFRRLLETHRLTERIFATINAHLADKGLLLKEGTVVDATIIAAPSSTKNQSGKHDPEMHQTKKGNLWHFGMKAHIGVDAESGVITLGRLEEGIERLKASIRAKVNTLFTLSRIYWD